MQMKGQNYEKWQRLDCIINNKAFINRTCVNSEILMFKHIHKLMDIQLLFKLELYKGLIFLPLHQPNRIANQQIDHHI